MSESKVNKFLRTYGSPKQKSDVIDKIIKNGTEFEKKDLIDNEKLEPHHVEALTNDRNSYVRARIARSNHLQSHHIDKMVDDDDIDVRLAISRSKDLQPHHIDKLAGDPDTNIRRGISVHKDLQPHNIDKLLDADDDTTITSNLSRRKDLQPHQITKLANHRSLEVRYNIAKHPNLQSHDIDTLIKDKSPSIKGVLAERDDLQPHHIDAFIKDNNQEVLSTLARRTDLNDNHVKSLLDKGANINEYTSSILHKNIRNNKNLSSTFLHSLLNHDNPEVAKSAYLNERTDGRAGLKSKHPEIYNKSLMEFGQTHDLDIASKSADVQTQRAVLTNIMSNKSHLNDIVKSRNAAFNAGESTSVIDSEIFKASGRLNHSPKLDGPNPKIDYVRQKDIAKIPEATFKKMQGQYDINADFDEEDTADVLGSNPTHINHVAQKGFGRYNFHAGHTLLMNSPHLTPKSLEVMGTSITKNDDADHIPVMAIRHPNITKEVADKIIAAHPKNKYINQMKSVAETIK